MFRCDVDVHALHSIHRSVQEDRQWDSREGDPGPQPNLGGLGPPRHGDRNQSGSVDNETCADVNVTCGRFDFHFLILVRNEQCRSLDNFASNVGKIYLTKHIGLLIKSTLRHVIFLQFGSAVFCNIARIFCWIHLACRLIAHQAAKLLQFPKSLRY